MSEYDSYKYNEAASLLRGTRWATDEEIMSASRKVRLSDPQWKCSGLPVISDGEKNTLKLTVERNAVNMGFQEHRVTFCADAKEAGGMA